jgi:uncharacterized lipoprotein YddW (UPF0748 family)
VKTSGVEAALKVIGRCGLFLTLVSPHLSAQHPPAASPPPVQREFRGAWIATVGNINWPSKRGLPVAEQKAELIRILDRAVALKLNAVIFQARPAAEVLYESSHDPWSEYLTGELGRAPEPRYDPLAFAIAGAHQRGLELHAWINPFRARDSSGKSAIPASHISQRQPALVRPYGRKLWLDPGEPQARAHALQTAFDLVERYDVDGLQFDDYFYPYPEKDAQGAPIPFPDDASWQRYQSGGGKLARDDWRRDNINQFVEQLYRGVKARKRGVKVGISPFGIWRPGHPPQIKGLDAYAALYADARLWLSKGWCDYFAPQLYWPVDAPGQSYPVLLKWWAEQNDTKRHLWPGNNLADITTKKWQPEEILRQIQLTRKQPGASGNILFAWRALANDGPLTDLLKKQAYTQPAMPPATPWLDSLAPGKPLLERNGNNEARWRKTGEEAIWLWVVQTRRNGRWQTEIMPGERSSLKVAGLEVVAVTAVDRAGNTSLPAVLELVKPAPSSKQP